MSRKIINRTLSTWTDRESYRESYRVCGGVKAKVLKSNDRGQVDQAKAQHDRVSTSNQHSRQVLDVFHNASVHGRLKARFLLTSKVAEAFAGLASVAQLVGSGSIEG